MTTMLRGIDTATSGMIALQRRQDSLTNNLANAETPGYKQDTSLIRSFPEMLLDRIRDEKQIGTSKSPQIGSLSMGIYNQETLPLFSQGILTGTNNPFDLAIQDAQLAPIVENDQVVKPSAFFAVQTADGGFQLTRNGSFTVNANGQLTTASGDLVLGQNGAPIASPALLSGNVVISENGEIIANPDGPARANIGNVGLVIVNNPNQLIKTSNGNYQLEGATPAMISQATPASVQIKQKMLEQSNVDLTQTMTSMMTNMRLYEANQKVLQAYDKTLEQLNSIGRV
jgi:flagellar basal-body rod protein FlgF